MRKQKLFFNPIFGVTDFGAYFYEGLIVFTIFFNFYFYFY